MTEMQGDYRNDFIVGPDGGRLMRQHRVCPSCKKGLMKFVSGSAFNNVATFRHRCNHCGKSERYKEMYPRMIPCGSGFTRPLNEEKE